MMQKTNLQKRKKIRLFLLGGIISAPLFYLVSIVQAFIRTGFDIRRHAISTLTLGDLGWIQSMNFIITGLLSILAAMGIRGYLRGSRGGTWGSLLIGGYGIGMILAGLFRPDPGLGFPSGAPEGMPTSMSLEAAVHSMAFFIAFISLIAACIVFARRFSAQSELGWRAYSLTTCIMAPLLIIIGMVINSWIGVIMAIAGMIAFGWFSALAARLRAEIPKV